MTDVWTFDASDGELLLSTGVSGRAARMGHRLTMVMKCWRASVSWDGAEPVSADLVVEVGSLQVLGGAGGVKALSGPEKAMIESNALKSLAAKRYPQIRFSAESSNPIATDDGYRLIGTLQIRGKSQEHKIGRAHV